MVWESVCVQQQMVGPHFFIGQRANKTIMIIFPILPSKTSYPRIKKSSQNSGFKWYQRPEEKTLLGDGENFLGCSLVKTPLNLFQVF